MFFLQVQQVLADTLSKSSKSEFFKQVDPFGLGMTVIGYGYCLHRTPSAIHRFLIILRN